MSNADLRRRLKALEAKEKELTLQKRILDKQIELKKLEQEIHPSARTKLKRALAKLQKETEHFGEGLKEPPSKRKKKSISLLDSF